MHGYPPETQEMGGIFYAEGPDFRAGSKLEEVRAIDVTPLICHLLGITASEDFDGSAAAFTAVMRSKEKASRQ